jgi:hypothetical protein
MSGLFQKSHERRKKMAKEESNLLEFTGTE